MTLESEFGLDPQGRLRFYGLYSGVVVKNSDPLKKNRVTLYVPQVTGVVETGWAKAAVGVLPQIKMPYGTFSSSATQPVSAANTATTVTFNTVEDDSAGISLTNGSKITVAEEGDYFIQFSAQVAKSQSSAAQADIWLKKNGVNIARTNSRITLSGNPNEELITLGYILDLKPKDYVQVAFSSADANVKLIAYGALSSPSRPAIPSIIATINLVANYLPKPGTNVWVMFEAGDPEFPVWLGAQA
jgi:hypothetical protein